MGIVKGRKVMCGYKELYPGASQQNIVIGFPFYGANLLV
jgi:hypothetical protein